MIFITASERMRVVVAVNVLGGGSWSTARRSKPKSGANDQLHCVGESRITSHNIAAFRHPTDSMKDSKQGELIEEESRWVESQILPRYIATLIPKTIRHDYWRLRLKRRHHRMVRFAKLDSCGSTCSRGRANSRTSQVRKRGRPSHHQRWTRCGFQQCGHGLAGPLEGLAVEQIIRTVNVAPVRRSVSAQRRFARLRSLAAGAIFAGTGWPLSSWKPLGP